ncbi:MAG: ATP synthase F1 subunit gamma [Ignavibacteriales bacterium]|nr:ATP synthase F1 subunit gamma [Ignavibacteriales bacterium]
MPSLRDIKNRIQGVKNTQQITKAMKMVAAARLRKAQQNIQNFNNYFTNLDNILSDISDINLVNENNYLKQRDIHKILFILVTSDRGLCGSFNLNIFRYIECEILPVYKNYFNEANASFICIGRKGFEYIRKNKLIIDKKYLQLFSDLKFDIALKLSEIIRDDYLDFKYDQVNIIYNEFLSTTKSQVKCEQFLPIISLKHLISNVDSSEKFIIEPDKYRLIKSIIPKYLNSKIWKILLDSYASELASRMLSMEMATENTKEIIRILSLEYNKKRQDIITREILEIVSGANALLNN